MYLYLSTSFGPMASNSSLSLSTTRVTTAAVNLYGQLLQRHSVSFSSNGRQGKTIPVGHFWQRRALIKVIISVGSEQREQSHSNNLLVRKRARLSFVPKSQMSNNFLFKIKCKLLYLLMTRRSWRIFVRLCESAPKLGRSSDNFKGSIYN